MTKLNLIYLVLFFATCAIGIENESEDDVGDIIIHGTEKSLTGTDRVAILRTKANHIRYSLISTGQECALKRFVNSKPVMYRFSLLG